MITIFLFLLYNILVNNQTNCVLGVNMHDFKNYVLDLEKLISYKTVCDKPSVNAPFGTEISKCLNFFLDLAKSFGFETINYDNYIGEIVFGEGEEVGIIGHLDVVPIGLGWETDPFTLTEKDGVFYGRGVSDDKAPLLSCLYALKELKDSGIKPSKKFRLLIGCDEETGWRDIDYLKTKTTVPEFGFSPDGDFPLSYAEKGIAYVNFTINGLKNFTDIKGGTVINAVCDYATARPLIKVDEKELKKFGLSLNEEGLIVSKGKSAHGSAPHLGKNAIKPLFEYFFSKGENVKQVLDCVFYDKLEVGKLKTEQGYLTFSPNIISEKDGLITIQCDCRFPAPLEEKDFLPYFKAFNLNVETFIKHPSVMVEKKGEFVQTLLNAYNTITGENAQPVSMGGSTFARAFNKGCSFGPKFIGQVDNIHDANEMVSKENLLTAYKIYKKAILDLATK